MTLKLRARVAGRRSWDFGEQSRASRRTQPPRQLVSPQTKAEEMPGERQCDRSPPPRRPRPCGSPRCRRGSAGAASPLWLTTEAAGPQGRPPPRDTPEGVRVREGLSLPIRSQGGECWRRPVMRRLGVTPTAPCLLFLGTASGSQETAEAPGLASGRHKDACR